MKKKFNLATSINSPLPTSLAGECKKATKILNAFLDPGEGLDIIIPPTILEKAQGLAIFTVLKAGFVFSGRAGSGLVVARLPDGSWSAPSAIVTGGMGAGGQIGAELTDFVLVLNTKEAVKTFSHFGNVQLGGNVSIAAGPVGRNAEASGSATFKHVSAIYSYSKTRGLFAGVSLEGTVVITRNDANEKLYGERFTAKQLLNGTVPPPREAESLYRELNARFKSFGNTHTVRPIQQGDTTLYKNSTMSAPGTLRIPPARLAIGYIASAPLVSSPPPLVSSPPPPVSSPPLFVSSPPPPFMSSPPLMSSPPPTFISHQPLPHHYDNYNSSSSTLSSQPSFIHHHPSSASSTSSERPYSFSLPPPEYGESNTFVMPSAPKQPLSPTMMSPTPQRFNSLHRDPTLRVSPVTPQYNKPNQFPNDSPRSEKPHAVDDETSSNESRRTSLNSNNQSVAPPPLFEGQRMSFSRDIKSPIASAPPPPCQKARALYAFHGEQPGDLSFQEGDVIIITDKTDSQNDWWTGKLRENSGTFPANYVQLL